MNKLQKLLACFSLLFFLCAISLEAQVYDRRGQAIYVELGGPSILYSLNYECRFTEKTEGLGARIGLSYMTDWTSFPVNINYLLGKKDKNHFLELGIGATYFIYPEKQIHGGKSEKSQVVGFSTIMYRFHPRYGKFFFKAGLTPFYGYLNDGDEERQFTGWFGIALGRAF